MRTRAFQNGRGSMDIYSISYQITVGGKPVMGTTQVAAANAKSAEASAQETATGGNSSEAFTALSVQDVTAEQQASEATSGSSTVSLTA
jgi:hypothetical protein